MVCKEFFNATGKPNGYPLRLYLGLQPDFDQAADGFGAAGIPRAARGIQVSATHRDKKQTVSYIRRQTKKIAATAEARKQSRTADDGGGTA
jgi:hypothetical protein